MYGTLTNNLTGSPTVSIGNAFDKGDIADILVDTGTTIPASLTTIDNEIAVIDGIVDDILTDTSTTLDDKIDTIDSLIDAIKAKTDSLTFTESGNVDANIQYVNDVEVTGTGAEGDEWGP